VHVTDLGEAVEEDHHVGIPLRMHLIDMQLLQPRAHSPVDATDAITRLKGAHVRELDPVATAP
jgi:hypothetical protein